MVAASEFVSSAAAGENWQVVGYPRCRRQPDSVLTHDPRDRVPVMYPGEPLCQRVHQSIEVLVQINTILRHHDLSLPTQPLAASVITRGAANKSQGAPTDGDVDRFNPMSM